MKKLSFVAALLMGLSVLPVKAATTECAYSPLQNFIRNVRNHEDVEKYIKQGIQFNEKPRCGGTLMQLAVLRGNPNVLVALLNQERSRANEVSSIEDFRIQGGPRQLPIVLFAAYYAPNQDMLIQLVNAGADFSVVDEQGRNILWYMDQNPVLRSSYVYDQLNSRLLEKLSQSQVKPEVVLEGEKTTPTASLVQNQPTVGGEAMTIQPDAIRVPQPTLVEATTN